MEFSARLLDKSHVSQILKVQSVCFPEVAPESDASFISKIQQSPNTCWGIFYEQQLKAYLISLPWIAGTPIKLNQEDAHCKHPNCLYLHDLAVLPEMRGTGAAKTLLQHFFNALNESTFDCAALVAIQGSVPYWKKQGFTVVSGNNELKEKLKSYGTDADYMEYRKQPAS